MSKSKTAAINYGATGTTVKGGIKLLDDEFDLVYAHLNSLFGLQYGATEPADKNTGDVWIDSSSTPRLLYYDGDSWEPLAENMQGYFHYYSTTGTQTALDSGVKTVILHDTAVTANTDYNAGTGRYTPQLAGYYEVNATVSVDGSGSAEYLNAYVYITKNSTDIAYGTTSVVLNGSEPDDTVTARASAIVLMNGTTDYLSVSGIQWSQTGSSARDLTSETVGDNAFWGRYLGNTP